MGLFKTIGSVVGIDDVVAEVGKTVRQLLPNKEAEREFDEKMAEIADRYRGRLHEEMLAQIEVNKAEAQHASIFVAGWRPFIGWACGAGVAWNFVGAPLLGSLGLDAQELQIEYLITLVCTLLGSSGIRTFEKVQGVSRDTLKNPPAEPENLLPDSYLVPNEEEGAPWTKR